MKRYFYKLKFLEKMNISIAAAPIPPPKTDFTVLYTA